MEKIELIRFGENGQGYVDFEALESVTGEEFVRDILESIDIHKVDFPQASVVCISNGTLVVDVYVRISESCVKLYTYDKDMKFYTKMIVNTFQVSKMAEIMGVL